MNELISVIVPVYNIKPYIERCLDSICGQTHQDLEIIAVDDGSTDGSGEYLDAYALKDSRIRVIHQKNGGVTSARLRGAREAAGEWIGFVDGDDEIEPDMYEFLLNNALKYKADISHCGYQMIFADGRVHYFHNTGCLAKQDKTAGLIDLLDGSRIEPGLCNKLFSKTLFQSLLHDGRMPEDIKINEDLLMNYFLFSEARLSVFEDVCKYHYIVRSSSASRSKQNDHKIYDPIRVKEEILKNSEEELRPYAKRAYIDTCLNTYNGLLLSDDSAFREDEEKVRGLLKEEKAGFRYLPPKRRAAARMALRIPGYYRRLYRFYVKHMQENPYE